MTGSAHGGSVVANESRFGLGGGIFSKDVDYPTVPALKQFDTDMVFINHFNLATPEMPFGAVRDSGYGRKHGVFDLREFGNAKAIAVAAWLGGRARVAQPYLLCPSGPTTARLRA
ncbi:aldehyde dehydrogenase family protein [Salipiger sp. PrR003]|uniref:aldehyde dehydrogenase family protein n=1 Tax=Salipiger sp. PrR003 TaxID=2706776 RepID=UPI0013D8FCBE|nr:aldehyde dehydrogenase family protein [Salipiger sp. PrR003]NDV51502.1 aldehyde dehydrogenase family protein [Salipiger sp. PrR003]